MFGNSRLSVSSCPLYTGKEIRAGIKTRIFSIEREYLILNLEFQRVSMRRADFILFQRANVLKYTKNVAVAGGGQATGELSG